MATTWSDPGAMNAPSEDLELIGQLLARQPVEVMQRLARHFTVRGLISRRAEEGARARH
jgi:hypothetical protein